MTLPFPVSIACYRYLDYFKFFSPTLKKIVFQCFPKHTIKAQIQGFQKNYFVLLIATDII